MKSGNKVTREIIKASKILLDAILQADAGGVKGARKSVDSAIKILGTISWPISDGGGPHGGFQLPPPRR